MKKSLEITFQCCGNIFIPDVYWMKAEVDADCREKHQLDDSNCYIIDI